jgi:hypothetical protein
MLSALPGCLQLAHLVAQADHQFAQQIEGDFCFCHRQVRKARSPSPSSVLKTETGGSGCQGIDNRLWRPRFEDAEGTRSRVAWSGPRHRDAAGCRTRSRTPLTADYGVSVLRTSRALGSGMKEDQTIKPRERG